MILVDTSAWIDYLRDADTPATRTLHRLVDEECELGIAEPITMELLAGGDTPTRAEALERLVNGLPQVSVEPRLDFRQAASFYLQVRRSGQTVRSLVDCLIAAIAIRSQVPLLHKDRDYDAMARVLPLDVYPLDH